jgi:hypothetical protein
MARISLIAGPLILQGRVDRLPEEKVPSVCNRFVKSGLGRLARRGHPGGRTSLILLLSAHGLELKNLPHVPHPSRHPLTIHILQQGNCIFAAYTGQLLELRHIDAG